MIKVVLYIMFLSVLADAKSNYVVKVLDLDDRGGGTGFFIKGNKNTYILTNAHVCEEESFKIIETYRGKVRAKVLRTDSTVDLCLIKATGGGYRLAKYGISCADFGITIGYPSLEYQSTSGAQVCGNVYLHRVISGQSGSPVLNHNNEVVGVVQGAFTETGTGYLITLPDIQKFMEGL